MLDFRQIATPANHGEVLVLPSPAAWVGLARENQRSLASADAPLLDSTVAEWRTVVRKRVLSTNDTLVFVLGHQPEFIHPGVWAKHVVAMRAAAACDGAALNLVVDNDAPARRALRVPAVEGGHVVMRTVPFVDLPSGFAYEQVRRHTPAEIDLFEKRLMAAMEERFPASMMTTFFTAFRQASDARDWVDQAVTGRRAVEAALGVSIEDRRISDIWCSPLLVDMVLNVERFTEVYNGALGDYRRTHGVRGARRPIPDLSRHEGRWEIPVWAYRADEPRRRLFVVTTNGSRQLFADDEFIGVVPAEHLHSCEDVAVMLADLAGWRLRPRALTLTIWARVLLADLFIHGIGGAKYDRISDLIIERYYGVKPPHMACVSATLHMGLPAAACGIEEVREARTQLRDLTFNPQRHLPANEDIADWIRRRSEAVRQSVGLRKVASRDRVARRRAFHAIREASAGMLAIRPDAVTQKEAALTEALGQVRESQWARGREYFFGLYERDRLEVLLDALPDERDFRV